MSSKLSPLNEALCKAAQHGNLLVVETLLGFGADPNSQLNGISVLELALKDGNFEISQALLRAGATPVNTTGDSLDLELSQQKVQSVTDISFWFQDKS